MVAALPAVEREARCPAVDIQSLSHAAWRRGERMCEPPHSNWSTSWPPLSLQ
jgi:hypothetical protein